MSLYSLCNRICKGKTKKETDRCSKCYLGQHRGGNELEWANMACLSACKGLWREGSRTEWWTSLPTWLWVRNIHLNNGSTVLGVRLRKENSLGLQAASEKKSVSLIICLFLWPQETCLQENRSLRSAHKHKENVWKWNSP